MRYKYLCERYKVSTFLVHMRLVQCDHVIGPLSLLWLTRGTLLPHESKSHYNIGAMCCVVCMVFGFYVTKVTVDLDNVDVLNVFRDTNCN